MSISCLAISCQFIGLGLFLWIDFEQSLINHDYTHLETSIILNASSSIHQMICSQLFVIVSIIHKYSMQSDKLLQEWKQAKQICAKIIAISKKAHLNYSHQEPENNDAVDKQTSKQFMSVYDVVYRLCLTKEKQENMISMVYRDYKEILKMALLDMCQLINDEKDIYRLLVVRKIWDAYTDIQKRLTNMFSYLNRSFHKKDDRIGELDKTGINIILSTLFTQNSLFQYQLLYFKEINRIRKIEQFSHHQILADIIDVFYKIHLKIIGNTNNKMIRTIYTQMYGKYQKVARDYYQKKYKTLNQLCPPQYFVQVSKIYTLQAKIAEKCFVISGENLINNQFSDELIKSYRQTLLESSYGLKFILKNNQIGILKLIVQLNMRLSKNIDGFKEQFEDYIYDEMKKYIDEIKNELLLIKTTTNYCCFIQKVLKKNQEFINIFQESLAELGNFVAYYKSGMEKSFRKADLPTPIEEVLAVYVDYKFKTEMDQSVYEEEVKNIIIIFNYIENKDYFLAKYSHKLAKRILSLNEVSIKNHEGFIANLKMNCGLKYTEKLQTIICEYNNSIENQHILAKITEKQKLQVGLTVKVFSEGVWPIQNTLELPINLYPPELQQAAKCLQIFREQQFNKKSIRISALDSRIRWSYYFDKEVAVKSQCCYFDTNCLQGAILYYLYKNRPNRICSALVDQWFEKVSPKLLRQSIDKMCDCSENILQKIEEGEQVYYRFNLYMKTNKKLISFEQGANHEEEKQFQQPDLSKDRQIIIDANIAKLMKAKKVLDFKIIIHEITKMIQVFVPQTKDIKLSINRLINKQILLRDEKDKEQIRYRQ